MNMSGLQPPVLPLDMSIYYLSLSCPFDVSLYSSNRDPESHLLSDIANVSEVLSIHFTLYC
jgi:hypothetical protein